MSDSRKIDVEEITFNMIRDYCKKNRTFEIDQIIPYLIVKFSKISIDITHQGIKEILKSLIKKNMIAEGSKLTKKDILINAKRIKIFNFINENPGVLFNEIVKGVGISNYVVYWHVNILEKFDFIKTSVIDNYDVYHNASLDYEDVKFIYFHNKEKSKKIIDYLVANDIGATKTHLSNTLKMHPNTIAKYLNYLEEINVLVKETISNKELYFLSEGYLKIEE